jgi:hypothetical protein
MNDLTMDIEDMGPDNGVPTVTFLAPSGREYEHQADFEGDVVITVPRHEVEVEEESDGDGNELVSISVPLDDMEALMLEGFRVTVIKEIEAMDPDDLDRLSGLMSLYDLH